MTSTISLPARISGWSLLALLVACDATVPHHPQARPAGAVPTVEGARGSADYVPPPVLDLTALADLDTIIPKLASKRVVFIGETHDRLDHHLNQLEIIRRLHRYNPDLAIGMEFFQQPFQQVLDDYVAGRLDEREMLKKTEYFDRWRFDYRLYRPILSFARAQGIPLVALNLPREITRKASAGGLEALSEEERAGLPREIDRSDTAYRDRLRRVFEFHRMDGNSMDFERFMDVQLLWDEGMAERAVDYLRQNPNHNLVILAGNGHLAHRSGIPNRVLRRMDMASAIVLNGEAGDLSPDLGDYLLFPEKVSLPPPGRLGVLLEDIEGGGVAVGSFSRNSAGEAAGLKAGDRIFALDGHAVERYTDIRLALWDKNPQDNVRVMVRRKAWWSTEAREISFDVTLN